MIYHPHTKDILLYIIMPFPSPSPLIIYLPGIALGPSIQFLLMKNPSHFELCQRSLALLLHCPFPCSLLFFFKLDFTAGGRTFSFLSAPSELPPWKRRPTTLWLLSLCRWDLRKGYCRHSMTGWKEQLIFSLGTWILESLRKENLLRICLWTFQLYHLYVLNTLGWTI